MMTCASQGITPAHHIQSFPKKIALIPVRKPTEGTMHPREESCHCLKRTASEEQLLLVFIYVLSFSKFLFLP